MTALGRLLGLGTDAEQARINHDLRLARLHGLTALRDAIGDHPVSVDLYVAALARTAYRDSLRDRWANEDHASDEERANRRGGTR